MNLPKTLFQNVTKFATVISVVMIELLPNFSNIYTIGFSVVAVEIEGEERNFLEISKMHTKVAKNIQEY